MKQKDVALILVIAFLSAIVSLLLSNFLLGSPQKRQQKVEIVPIISAEIQVPNNKYFNDAALDPTQLIQIGDNSNPKPFNGR